MPPMRPGRPGSCRFGLVGDPLVAPTTQPWRKSLPVRSPTIRPSRTPRTPGSSCSEENPAFDTIAGLPLHPLVVHATEVIVPAVAVAVALAVVAAALVLWRRKDSWSRSYRDLAWIPVVLAVAGVLVSTGTTVQAVRVGHSGATAVWSGDVASSSSGTDSDKG